MRLPALGSILLAALVVWLAGAAAAWDPISFETGSGPYLLRSGRIEPDARRVREAAGGFEGRLAVRLAASQEPATAVEFGWVQLAPGDAWSVSCYLRAETEQGLARLSWHTPDGEAVAASFPVATEWQRYALPVTPLASQPWHRPVIAVDGESRAAVWVDAVQLDRGEPTAYRPTAAIGVTPLGRRLQRAGQSVRFRLRLYLPDGGPATPVRWRLLDAFGQTAAHGARLLDPAAGRAASVDLDCGRLPPGAWRLVAWCDVDDRQLSEDSTVVVVTPELGGPNTWIGVEEVHGELGWEVINLLRLGLIRGTVAPDTDLATVNRGPLRRQVRDGFRLFGYLPGWQPDDDAWAASVTSRAAFYRDLVGVWEAPPAERRSVADQLAYQAAASAAVRAGNPRALTMSLALDASSDAMWIWLEQILAAGGAQTTDAVRLDVGALPPEDLPAGSLAALIGQLEQLSDQAGRRLPVTVATAPIAAEPFDRSLATSPTRQALGQLAQASLLARHAVAARAGGAGCYFYRGAPWSQRPEHLTLGTPLHGDLYEPTGAPLPAVAALDHAEDRLRGRRLAEQVALGRGVTCYLWSGRRPLATIWHHGDASAQPTIHLPLRFGQVRLSDLFGRWLTGWDDTATVSLRLTEHPLHLEAHSLSGGGFAAAWRGARVSGVPTATASLVPLARALAVRLSPDATQPGDLRLSLDREPIGVGSFATPAAWTLPTDRPLPPPDRLSRHEVTVSGPDHTWTSRHEVCWLPVAGPGKAAPAWPVHRVHAGEAPTPDNLTCQVRLNWDSEALYLGWEVIDNELASGDAVELHLTTDLANGAEAATLGSSAPGRHSVRIDAMTGVASRLCRAGLSSPEVEVSHHGAGYTVRLRWPWSDLGLRPSAGLALGADLGVIDHDSQPGAPVHLRWRGAAPSPPGWLILE